MQRFFHESVEATACGRAGNGLEKSGAGFKCWIAARRVGVDVAATFKVGQPGSAVYPSGMESCLHEEQARPDGAEERAVRRKALEQNHVCGPSKQSLKLQPHET